METRLRSTKFLKDKTGVAMIGNKMQDNTVYEFCIMLFPTILRLFPVKLRIQLSDLREMMSYRAIKKSRL